MKHEHLVLIGKGVLTVMAAFVPFLLFYLAGVFITYQWDAGEWPSDGRVVVGIAGLFSGCIVGGLAGTALYLPKAFRS
jgi:hypothetical protein